tara:strand:- start:1878 stop:2657 length:780 start_codon:yes stop_codon:yes gene_type:complete
MAVSDNQKVDYLWKKLAYGVSKTDTNDNKLAPNESIASPLLLRGDRVWAEAGNIPSSQPSSNSSIVTVYSTSQPVETTEDNTSTASRTWKTGITDWIPPEIGSTYQVKVYIHTSGDAANASSGTQVFAVGSGNNDEWFFDYQSGVLHFIGTNLPDGVNFSGKSVYVSGARYAGILGVGTSNADFNDSTLTGTTSITRLVLSNVLGTEHGGTGLSTFTGNGVLFAANSSVLSFATGSAGKLMQVGDDGTPGFDDLDGGSF